MCCCYYSTLATVTASSYQQDHPASQAIDDDPKGETCYHSKPSSHSWWEADLGSEKFIRDIIVFYKVIVILPFTVYIKYQMSHSHQTRTVHF